MVVMMVIMMNMMMSSGSSSSYLYFCINYCDRYKSKFCITFLSVTSSQPHENALSLGFRVRKKAKQPNDVLYLGINQSLANYKHQRLEVTCAQSAAIHRSGIRLASA